MDRASSKDNVTSCEYLKDITEPESECVPYVSPSIHHTTTLPAADSKNEVEYDSTDAYVPMFTAAAYLNEYEMANNEDAQEAAICETQTSGHPLCVSSDRDRLYEQVTISKAEKCPEIDYSISELLESKTLPQVLQVTQGHTGGSKQESLNQGDVVLSYCLISREVVLAESTTGVRFTIPLNSHHKFFLVQDNINEFADIQKLSSQFARCNTVTELVKLAQLPRVVKATLSSKGKTPYESVEKGMVLLLKAVAKRDGRITLVTEDLNGDERCLREKCKGGFELRPRDTWLLIEEIVQHSSLPTKVFLANHQILADSDIVDDLTRLSEDSTLRCQPFTLLCTTKQTYLVMSKHNKSIDAAFDSELVLEVPTTLSIRMKCITLMEEKQEKSLLQLAKTVYERIQLCPGQLVLDNSLAMTDVEHKLQEVLYLTTCSHDTVEQIRLMAGGRPKVRLPALALPVAHKVKKRSHAYGLNEEGVEGMIIQLKDDIQKLEELLRECKDRLQRLEMNLQARDNANS